MELLSIDQSVRVNSQGNTFRCGCFGLYNFATICLIAADYACLPQKANKNLPNGSCMVAQPYHSILPHLN